MISTTKFVEEIDNFPHSNKLPALPYTDSLPDTPFIGIRVSEV